ncbi:MAG: hypothetical protein R3F19_11570 [Verrucomicrobiales bacterium]
MKSLMHDVPTHEKPLNPAGCAFKLALGSCAVIALVGVTVAMVSNIPWVSDQPWAVGFFGALTLAIGVEIMTVILSPGSSTPFNILGAGGFFSRGKDNSPDALLQRGEAEKAEFKITRAILVEDNSSSGESYFSRNHEGLCHLPVRYEVTQTLIWEESQGYFK